jgi:hypothetical protein
MTTDDALESVSNYDSSFNSHFTEQLHKKLCADLKDPQPYRIHGCDSLGGDRTVVLSRPSGSIVSHGLGDEDFFSGAGKLNSAADTVSQGNQVF